MARIVVVEKGLASRFYRACANTSYRHPYYTINPSGRVPYLVRNDGIGMEESTLICSYLDHLDGQPELLRRRASEWEWRRLDALASSLLDGLSVWGREIVRPETEQSPTVIRHETARAHRMVELWEKEIDCPVMRGKLNLVQIRLACALGLDARNPQFRWRPRHPKLSAWFDSITARPSFAATVPSP